MSASALPSGGIPIAMENAINGTPSQESTVEWDDRCEGEAELQKFESPGKFLASQRTPRKPLDKKRRNPAVGQGKTRRKQPKGPIPTDGAADFEGLLKQAETPSPEADNYDCYDDCAFSGNDWDVLDAIAAKRQVSPVPPPASKSNKRPSLKKTPPPMPAAAATNPTEPATKQSSPSSDEFNFSQQDLEDLDRVVLQQVSTTSAPGATAAKKDPVKEKDPYGDFPDVDFDQILRPLESASLGQPAKQESGAPSTMKTDDDKADPFGDLPDIVFENIDKAIEERKENENIIQRDLEILAQHQSLQNSHPPPDQPVRNQRDTTPIGPNQRRYLTFSRYKIVDVCTNPSTFTKTIAVCSWTNEMLHHNLKSIHHTDASGELRLPNEKEWPAEGRIHLRGEWYYSHLVRGDVIHICSLTGRFKTGLESLPMILHTRPPPGSDQDDLVLVIHPDQLLTPTTISETMTCNRRAILKSRIGSTGLAEKAPLFGTMRHEILEESLRDCDFSRDAMSNRIRRVVRKNAEGLLSCNVASSEAEAEMYKFVPQLEAFVREFTDFASPGSKKLEHGTVLEDQTNKPSIRFLATQVEAIEELAISPELGLKGYIDLILEALSSGNGQMTLKSLFGVELKTGHYQKTQMAHMAQLALYILVMQARYGSNSSNSNDAKCDQHGMLLYMNGEATRAVNVSTLIFELKTLIGQRNAIAIEQKHSSMPRGFELADSVDASHSKRVLSTAQCAAHLPSVINDTFKCNKCYMQRECMLYAATNEQTAGRLPGKEQMLQEHCSHLSKQELDFFIKWDGLVDVEAHASQTLISETWLRDAKTIEQESGKCISQLEVVTASADDQDVLTLCRSSQSQLRTPLSTLGLEIGCHVVLSIDTVSWITRNCSESPPRMHIVRGFLRASSTNDVKISASIDDLKRVGKLIDSCQRKPLFRLDRDNVATGVGTLRQNLINFMRSDDNFRHSAGAGSRRKDLSGLRQLIVGTSTPIFEDISPSRLFERQATSREISGFQFNDLEQEYATLNSDQQAAVHKIMRSSDYALIQGFPGTGKSAMISFVSRLLVAQGKRVLLTAYTHSAVDNILLKLRSQGIASSATDTSCPMVRIGQFGSCHPDTREYLAANIAKRKDCGSDDGSTYSPSAESLQAVMREARLVGATALTIPRSPLIQHDNFDVVIVDEAGQISMPAILGPLMSARRFVLVGDHMQLPPLVCSELAQQGGYGVSLMKQLAETHQSSVVQLTQQYRMHEDICTLSNDIVYKGKMKCASEAIARQRLSLPRQILDPNMAEWVKEALDPNRAVIFINTDGTDGAAMELEGKSGKGKGGSIVNPREAEVVERVASCLTSCGVEATSIGVICPFRAQIGLMEKNRVLGTLKEEGMEISTIDRYQGRDKSVIILSFVRSNAKHRVGRLLEDVRRLNVALTRAKSKLIMIGSFQTLLHGCTVLGPALQRIEQSGWLVKCPPHLTL